MSTPAPPPRPPATRPRRRARATYFAPASRSSTRAPSSRAARFDDAKLAELADSIKVHGIIVPLVVRPRPGGGYFLIAGERRWRAAQRAGLHEIPVVVQDVEEGEPRSSARSSRTSSAPTSARSKRRRRSSGWSTSSACTQDEIGGADRQGPQHRREHDAPAQACRRRCASSSRTRRCPWATRARCSGSRRAEAIERPRARWSRSSCRCARPKSSSRRRAIRGGEGLGRAPPGRDQVGVGARSRGAADALARRSGDDHRGRARQGRTYRDSLHEPRSSRAPARPFALVVRCSRASDAHAGCRTERHLEAHASARIS